ncbi:hypothetical protein BC941DRAFT_410585 [Chlamydoabsidia padenii]|nr:hypothetical protein BC941DRAFT_410585 [Chlamydoabsidia padenii]
MDSTTRISSPSLSRAGRSSSPSRRNTDRERELQRLKSRGVVSVLNKTFESPDDRTFLTRSPSPSSNEQLLRQPRSSSSIRSTWHQETNRDDDDSSSSSSSRKQQRRSYATPPPALPTPNDNVEEQVDWKDQYQQTHLLLQQTQQALALCQLEQQKQQKAPVQELCDIIRKQDKLIDTLESAAITTPQTTEPWRLLRQELDQLKLERNEYQDQIRALRRALDSSQNETRQLTLLAQALLSHKNNKPDPPLTQPITTNTTTSETTTIVVEDDAHREFTQELQTRLSLSDEVAHLALWDYTALDRMQAAKRTSLASSQDTHHSAFWKGMKKKLGV